MDSIILEINLAARFNLHFSILKAVVGVSTLVEECYIETDHILLLAYLFFTLKQP